MGIETCEKKEKKMEYYRADGVRITHDPYHPSMAKKYGLPGETDSEGFDPYADSVGPGIYGGVVKRDENGEVVVGAQYQNHNPRPGPVYAGGGYTLSTEPWKMTRSLLNFWEDILTLSMISRQEVHSLFTCAVRAEETKVLCQDL